MSRYLVLLWLAFQLTASAPVPYRQDLANTTFNFLYKHAVCMEGTEPPCDWVYDGAYQLHWAAKQLYGQMPLSKITMPESSWNRGGYKEMSNPLTLLEHQSIKWQIWLLITYGIEVSPAALAKLNG